MFMKQFKRIPLNTMKLTQCRRSSASVLHIMLPEICQLEIILTCPHIQYCLKSPTGAYFVFDFLPSLTG